jgi:hypothetical protein
MMVDDYEEDDDVLTGCFFADGFTCMCECGCEICMDEIAGSFGICSCESVPPPPDEIDEWTTL